MLQHTDRTGALSVSLYRGDIDGLRAIAVTSVIIFHYFPTLLTGGFVGVDIFFVISGYLITGILQKDIAAGRFSLLRFYDRRIRRIFPALLVVIGASLATGYWLLAPGDYADLGLSAAYSAASFANIYFLNQTSYFDQKAILKPLLHLWSLGVEEQFYLAWPLLLFGINAIARGSRRAILLMTGGIALASFALAVREVNINPKAAFFLPHTRAWELGLGAMLALAPQLKLRANALEAVRGLGLALILCGCVALTEADPFPGANALAPCIGAGLLVWSSTSSSLISDVIGSGPLRFIGKISYSLYLWHWPLLVFYRWYNNGTEPTSVERFGIALAAVAIAWISWRVVEQPTRKWRIPPIVMVPGGLASAIALVAAAIFVVQQDGFPERIVISPETLKMTSQRVMWEWPCLQTRAFKELPGLPDELRPIDVPPGSYCVLGANWDSASAHGIIWGDSHSEHFAPMIDMIARSRNVAVLLYRACSPVIHAPDVNVVNADPTTGGSCAKSREDGIKFIADHQDIKLVMFAAAWSNYAAALYTHRPSSDSEASLSLLSEGLTDLFHRFEAPGREIYVIGDVPQWASLDPVPCALRDFGSLLRMPCSSDQRAVSFARYTSHHGRTDDVLADAATRGGAHFIPTAPKMCDGRSHCIVKIDDEFLYRDPSHIRRNLTEPVMKKFINLAGLEEPFAGFAVAKSASADRMDCPAGPEKVTLEPPFTHVDGNMYLVMRPDESPLADTDQDHSRSRTLICESGKLLWPPHNQSFDIIQSGMGRYSHYSAGILFSASDNSDPNTNGRRYEAVFFPDKVLN
ncbi:hypothetical protein BSN85_35045 [Bradyrhizobium brasilense]|uniref:acyltransferase family protein n=1 Tax=Bradyrhizobium brasilense TaxID=1419277 RepID=UPI0009756C8B|nr:acyltransferase family protein [Bradyrhizobium brasilense]OMI00031.1 hypothetical protein BSN85_35045 [Bradyrhizobium brasilense]